MSSRVVDFLDGLDTESVLKEVGVVHDDVENDGGQGKVESVGDSVAEDLGKVPVVGGHGRQHSVDCTQTNRGGKRSASDAQNTRHTAPDTRLYQFYVRDKVMIVPSFCKGVQRGSRRSGSERNTIHSAQGVDSNTHKNGND